ncbi:MAG: hypothetical protein ACE5D8_05680 [Fidelibacterota bacterium]
MSNEIKSGFGYLIPATALVGYVVSLFANLYLVSIIFAVLGILGWFLYALVMEIKLPQVMGNMIIVFSLLIGVGIFLAYGLEQDIFGGYLFKMEGSVFALLTLLFGVLGGILFNRSRALESPALSEEDRTAVQSALENAENGSGDPKVIIVKQEQEQEKEPQPVYDPSLYGYPPEDYYDDDDDEEWEYEDEEWDEEDEED